MTLSTIAQVLNGHNSPETAYVVDDYPYGFRLRCKIRYWLETATKGAKKGQTRLVSQTTDPKALGEAWNKPKGSTYSTGISLMYLDENSHVHCTVLDSYTWESPGFFDRVLAAPGLTDDDREAINVLTKLLQKQDVRREERRLEREAALKPAEIEAPLKAG